MKSLYFFFFICGKWNVYFEGNIKRVAQRQRERECEELRKNKSVLSAHKQVYYLKKKIIHKHTNIYTL